MSWKDDVKFIERAARVLEETHRYYRIGDVMEISRASTWNDGGMTRSVTFKMRHDSAATDKYFRVIMDTDYRPDALNVLEVSPYEISFTRYD